MWNKHAVANKSFRNPGNFGKNTATDQNKNAWAGTVGVEIISDTYSEIIL